ncbi:MAG: ETC complex I subunit [Alphaproteobacteria bacterium]
MTATRKARIFRPVKTATQSGRAKTQLWVLEFERSDRVAADPLMGWIGGGDTRRQLLLKFPSRAAAEAYAAKHGIVCTVEMPHEPYLKPKSYADNFNRPPRPV